MSNLYDRKSIAPQQLIMVLRECVKRWPAGRLHKNDVTKNLTVKVEGIIVGEVNLLDATLDVFNDDDDYTAFRFGAASAGYE